MRTIAAVFGLVLATTASAHFVFLIPDATGKSVQVIFSDGFAPDEAVEITKIAKLKLTARDAAGKATPLTMEKVKDVQAYAVAVPGTGPRVVYGSVEYGVLAKGDAPPFLLRYHPKAILEPIPADLGKIGDAVPVELMAKVEAGKLRFQLLAAGKPVPENEVTVLAGDKSTKVTTDKDGWTPAQDATAGKYAAWTAFTTLKAGEIDGKKYETTKDYATLVVEVGMSGGR